MIGKPVTATEWNKILGTKNGAKIVEALAPFHEKPLALSIAMPGIRKEVLLLANAIGMPCKQVWIVTKEKLASTEWPPFGGKQRVTHWDPFWLPLNAHLKGTIGIREEYPSPEFTYRCALQRALMESLFNELWRKSDSNLKTLKEYKDYLGSSLDENMERNLFSVLECQIWLLAKYKMRGASFVGRFSALFLQGAFPIGIANGGKFLVIVA